MVRLLSVPSNKECIIKVGIIVPMSCRHIIESNMFLFKFSADHFFKDSNRFFPSENVMIITYSFAIEIPRTSSTYTESVAYFVSCIP